MNILILLPILKNTGPANVVASLVNTAIFQQHNITLCSFMGAETPYLGALTDPKIKIVQLKGFNFSSMLSVRRLIKEQKIDVVHSHCLLPDIANAFASFLNDNKSLSTVHCNLNDNYKNEYNFPKSGIYHFLHRLSLRFIDKIVSVSSEIKPFKHSAVIYNGIKEKQLTLMPSKHVNLIFAGRLIPSKNIMFLLDSFAYCNAKKPNTFELHIFGDGELYSHIASSKLPQVTLHGFVENYLAELPQNSILVNPSLFEGMPMAVVEALSSGLPTLLSSIAPHREIKEHIEDGVAMFDNNKQSFYQALTGLLSDKNEVTYDRKKMKQCVDAHFSDISMAEQYIQVYEDLISL